MRKLFACAFLCMSVVFLKAQNCTNWLNTPSKPSYVSVGKINITGNQITVEATFNRTTPYSGGLLYAGDLVTKHNTPSDANYLLRPNDAEITTSNGYYRTPDICEIKLNKTYHAAMVYDGTVLKFYRDGFLMSQIAATGNLYQNNWLTRFGWYEPQGFNTNFIGYINEVRIWNIARTQTDIQNYMNTPLPSPTTQVGLVAYYTFDDLLNKQGNATYNGVLGGAATINATNSSCLYARDSCNTTTPVILSSFDAFTINKKTVQIKWHTEEESNIDRYIIERSTSQNSFEKIGEVAASNNFSGKDYYFEDINLQSNINYYYRLLILEKSGTKKYSTTRLVKVKKSSSIDIYPNPTDGLFSITINEMEGRANLSLLNTTGQKVFSKSINIVKGIANPLDIRKYEKGNYYLIIQTDTDYIIQKITHL
ncbi:MAG: LamG-like jellyroll fold domain-containing protein [Ferruginibacter sp.]